MRSAGAVLQLDGVSTWRLPHAGNPNPISIAAGVEKAQRDPQLADYAICWESFRQTYGKLTT